MKISVVEGSIELSEKLPLFLWDHFWVDSAGRDLNLFAISEAYELSMVLPTKRNPDRKVGFRLQRWTLSESGHGASGTNMGQRWTHSQPINSGWVIDLLAEIQERGVPEVAAKGLITKVAQKINAMTSVYLAIFSEETTRFHFPKDWIGESSDSGVSVAETVSAG